MTRLYLLRHGTHDLLDKALAGRMPGLHLNAEGRAQAERAAAFFKGREIVAVTSSPLDRCLETAAPVAGALGLPVEIDAELIEIDCGEWTSCSFEALHADPRWHRWNRERAVSAAPGGESTRDVQARIMGALTRLAAAEPGPTVFVTHSDVIRLAVQTLLGASLDLYDRLQIDPVSVTTVDLWRGGGKVVRFNEATGP